MQTNKQLIIYWIVMAFSKVTSNSSEVTNNPSGRAPTEQLVYKSVIEVLRDSNEADASI